MKKYQLWLWLPLAGGCGAFLLRWTQLRDGFEAGTGLPIPGDPWGIALPALLLVLALLFLGLSRGVPGGVREEASLGRAFPVGKGGVLPMAAGVLTVLAAVCAFCALCPSARDGRRAEPSAVPLLGAAAVLVVRLVLTYRVVSVDPSLTDYYTELLAVVFLALAFYRLSSFAFRAGRTRRFAAYAALAIAFCLATLADRPDPARLLFYLGGAVTLFGFLLQRTAVLAAPWDNT